MDAATLTAWIGPCAAVTVFAVMLSLGLLLERSQIVSALQRRAVLAAVLFAVVVPVPILAVVVVKLFGLRGAVAAGIILMSISPGAPVALRRAIQAGGGPQFAPTLHLAIVMFAVVTVPVSVMVMAWIFSVRFAISPLDVARQVFFAQLLPLGVGAALRAWRPCVGCATRAAACRDLQPDAAGVDRPLPRRPRSQACRRRMGSGYRRRGAHPVRAFRRYHLRWTRSVRAAGCGGGGGDAQSWSCASNRCPQCRSARGDGFGIWVCPRTSGGDLRVSGMA